MNFTGKTALITGSGTIGGLGHAVATVLAAGGAEVVITGTDSQRAGQVVDEITGRGGRARFIEADLSDPAAVRRLADEAGPVDILINNAAVVPVAPTPQQEVTAYDTAFAVNTRAPFLLTAALAPKMIANGGGSIVNLSSAAAKLGAPGQYVDYAAAKGGIETFTIGLAKELAGEGIRVNAVRPGIIDTEIHASGGTPDRVREITPQLPMKRAGTADEVGEAIVWLLSERSSYTTGSVVEVTGGR